MFAIKTSKPIELIGWYGMFSLIGAYFLVSFNVLSADELVFQLLNFTGGIALIVLAISKKATQLAVLNVFWALIGGIAMIRIIF